MNILSRFKLRELLRSNAAIVLCIVMLIGVYLLVRDAVGIDSLLPILLIAGCFLMHLFMPHGHEHGHGRNDERNVDAPPKR